jgi:hypothetical protein
MTRQVGFGFVLVASVLAAACGGDDTNGGGAGSSGTGGSGGTGVDAGPDVSTGGAGAGGSTNRGGSGGIDGSPDGPRGGSAGTSDGSDGAVDIIADVDNGLGNAALGPDAATVTCPTIIDGSLDTIDGRQIGRHSRFAPVSACGMTKAFPGTAADPFNPHLYDVYRFSNPTASPVCYTFTLTYAPAVVTDAGSNDDAVSAQAGDAAVSTEAGDAAASAEAGDAATSTEDGDAAAGAEASADASSDVADAGVFVGPLRYMTAYGTFYPDNLAGGGYLGDVGGIMTPPQAMGITVPAGGTIDVVVYAVDPAPGGVGTYRLSCATQ